MWEAMPCSAGDVYKRQVEIILSALTDGFSGAMEEQSKTFAGRSSTLEGWEQEMANAQGEAYNTLRSEGKQRQIDYYAGIADEMSGLNAMIGAGEAAQENLKEQYLREAMNAVLKGTEIRLYEGEQAETLRKLRQEYMVIQADYADLQDEMCIRDRVSPVLRDRDLSGLYRMFELLVGTPGIFVIPAISKK